MTTKVVYAELVLAIGSIMFYECKSQTFLFGRPTYYWKFRDSPTYYGPFSTLLEAGANVDAQMRGTVTPPVPMTLNEMTPTIPIQEDLTNVIKVDFKSRKRIK